MRGGCASRRRSRPPTTADPFSRTRDVVLSACFVAICEDKLERTLAPAPESSGVRNRGLIDASECAAAISTGHPEYPSFRHLFPESGRRQAHAPSPIVSRRPGIRKLKDGTSRLPRHIRDTDPDDTCSSLPLAFKRAASLSGGTRPLHGFARPHVWSRRGPRRWISFWSHRGMYPRRGSNSSTAYVSHTWMASSSSSKRTCNTASHHSTCFPGGCMHRFARRSPTLERSLRWGMRRRSRSPAASRLRRRRTRRVGRDDVHAFGKERLDRARGR